MVRILITDCELVPFYKTTETIREYPITDPTKSGIVVNFNVASPMEGSTCKLKIFKNCSYFAKDQKDADELKEALKGKVTLTGHEVKRLGKMKHWRNQNIITKCEVQV